MLPLSDATFGRTASGARRNNCTHDRRGIHFVRHCRELSLQLLLGALRLGGSADKSADARGSGWVVAERRHRARR